MIPEKEENTDVQEMLFLLQKRGRVFLSFFLSTSSSSSPKLLLSRSPAARPSKGVPDPGDPPRLPRLRPGRAVDAQGLVSPGAGAVGKVVEALLEPREAEDFWRREGGATPLLLLPLLLLLLLLSPRRRRRFPRALLEEGDLCPCVAQLEDGAAAAAARGGSRRPARQRGGGRG